MNKEEARQRVKELCERFRYNLDVYKRSTYNEAQVRREFIDPFFEALGWDVSNKQGYAEQYKEVIHEDTIKVGSSTRAPDYSFRIGGQRKFFVEAKKPAVNIKEDVSPSYQLRRYAWSAKLPLSVVTDFEEFSVFDCRIKPNPNDKPGVGRIAYYTFGEYLDKFDELYDVFSRDAILKGSFDRYAESTKGKKGTAEVDSEFLKEIESWRELLAKNIALRNPEVSIYELNYAVQKIIDRIIFLRICEDRGIEPYGQLQTKAESGDVYTHLLNHFKLAESKYNSGIFDFEADKITSTLRIDDKVLKTIIQSLYYPKSPYEFSVLGVEILGNVYEQFLGKVIRLTAGHQAKVETKPEVKKAGGVYYTPQYIVDYIVKNTVGKLVEGKGKTPEEIAEIKILDPACGSGSFLIGAYSYLLRYHLDWYVNNEPKKHKKEVFQVRENEWYLTTGEKKRILLNNIFGVDIDPQAVEVTKLSLLLKVLEHENRESIDQQVKLGLEGVLPKLEGNVKCGNSLIGTDFYERQQGTLFDEEEMRRINVFDWNDDVKGFGEIMGRGGFDVVVGNPPYGAFFNEIEKAYIKQNFEAYKYRYDSYIYFVEKAINLTKIDGWISFITPELWLKLENGAPLRELISNSAGFEKLRIFGEKVFSKAVVNTIVFLLHRGVDVPSLKIETEGDSWELSSASWKASKLLAIDYRLKPEVTDLIDKIRMRSVSLSEFGDVIQGITPYDRYRGQDSEIIKNRAYHSKNKENETYGKWLFGKDITRYFQKWSGEWLSYGPWLAAPREERFFIGSRLLFREVPGVGKRIQATLVEERYYYGHSITPFKPDGDNNLSLLYLLGLSNSKLISWYGNLILPNFGKDTFPKLNPNDIKQLPIRTIDFSNPAEKAQHDKLVSLVDNMLELQKKYHDARMDRDKELYERQIKVVDTQINRLVSPQSNP
ncbi:MAG: TaqI-like C-terminal specificity domain-containing protein [Euryarchaeota archaeon]|nr:TaqI-like C-terminal specificity domain-containing protein [Euryarchaeota archaeon]